MFVRPFENMDSVLEVTCDARGLNASADVLTMTLHRYDDNAHSNHHYHTSSGVSDDDLLAFVSPKMLQPCTTSGEFAMCVVDQSNSRHTLLKTLVTDLQAGQARRYGCSLTSLDSRREVEKTSWSLLVFRNRKF
jgi:hypothetical protein